MGTSKSQPSPNGRRSEVGRAWRSADESLASSADSSKAFRQILTAYKGEYSDGAIEVLADEGVQNVEKIVRSFNSRSEGYLAIAEYMNQARKVLAETGTNSFLSELAVGCGVEAILKNSSDERIQSFNTNYFTKLVEYIVSRDLPRLFGNAGMPTQFSMEKFIEGVKLDISKSVNSKKTVREAISDHLKLIED